MDFETADTFSDSSLYITLLLIWGNILSIDAEVPGQLSKFCYIENGLNSKF